MNDQTKLRPEINLDKAKALGLRFCAERNARRESQQDIADALLLSKLQIIGLETGDKKSFYSAKMFGQAADKYAAYLSFEDKPSATLFSTNNDNRDNSVAHIIEPVATEKAPIEVEEAFIANVEAQSSDARPRKSRSFKTALLAIVAVSVIIVAYLAVRTEPTVAAPQPEPVAKAAEVSPPPNAIPTPTETAAATPTPTAQAQAEQKEPAKTEPVKTEAVTKQTQTATSSVATGHILIKFSGSSWVQTVDKNGGKQEKIYKAGDTLDLEPTKLQALVIGNASSVSVSDSKADVSLKPYVASGSQVARIIGPDIRKLGE